MSLTPKGMEMAETMQGIFTDAEREITAKLTEEERETLHRLLSKCLQDEEGSCE